MRVRDAKQWLDFIARLHPQNIVLGLDRIALVAQISQSHILNSPVFTVGGTNGKGSCVAFLEAILGAAGYLVGAYTSPHLLSFNERIRVAGVAVEDECLCQAFEKVETQRLKAEVSLTFFEFTTLAALEIFREQGCEVVILEVGLGGRLDAVNLVEPDVSIITSISLDHVQILGNTREAIGLEKAGIFRAHKPAICGDVQVPYTVIEYAQAIQARLYCKGRDFKEEVLREGFWSWQSSKKQLEYLPPLKLPVANASTALMALEQAQHLVSVSESAIRKGLEQACLPGRFEVHYDPIPRILDVAHNPASAELLARQLGEYCPFGGPCFAVVGVLEDKDIVGIFKPLIELINFWYVGGLQVERGAPVEILEQALTVLNVDRRHSFFSVSEAYQAACHDVGRGWILVFGSFYTVASVKAM